MTLTYKETQGKEILDFNENVLENISRVYNKFQEDSKLQGQSYYNLIINMSDEDLLFFIIKNYMFYINDIQKNKKIDNMVIILDKLLFYYARTALDNYEIQDQMKYTGTLDDMDQFIKFLDVNKNRTLMEMIAHMFIDDIIIKTKSGGE